MIGIAGLAAQHFLLSRFGMNTTTRQGNWFVVFQLKGTKRIHSFQSSLIKITDMLSSALEECKFSWTQQSSFLQ